MEKRKRVYGGGKCVKYPRWKLLSKISSRKTIRKGYEKREKADYTLVISCNTLGCMKTRVYNGCEALWYPPRENAREYESKRSSPAREAYRFLNALLTPPHSSYRYPVNSTCRNRALSLQCRQLFRDTQVCGRNRFLPPVE